MQKCTKEPTFIFKVRIRAQKTELKFAVLCYIQYPVFMKIKHHTVKLSNTNIKRFLDIKKKKKRIRDEGKY